MRMVKKEIVKSNENELYIYITNIEKIRKNIPTYYASSKITINLLKRNTTSSLGKDTLKAKSIGWFIRDMKMFYNIVPYVKEGIHNHL